MTQTLEWMEHEKWMRRCLELGERALAAGDPPVGALLVKAGVPIGEGLEAARSNNDVTCHAEIEAIRAAVQRAGVEAVRGATLYTTHEPCLMCSYVIRHYRVSQVVIGTTVPAVGGFSSAYPLLTATDIPVWSDPPRVVTDVLGEAARSLSRRYRPQPPNQA
jgi:tRNA(Arg) A34 adenosine deaminase TadA